MAAPIGWTGGVAQSHDERPADRAFYYRPKLRMSESLEPFLRHLAPGGDSFPEEKEAEELGGRLGELAERLRLGPRRVLDLPDSLLAPEFKGGRLTPVEEAAIVDGKALQVFRSKTMSSALVRDRSSFGEEIRAVVAGLETVEVAELLITAIDVDRGKGLARTEELAPLSRRRRILGKRTQADPPHAA